jgi:thiamine-monophosphate kinase
MMVESRLPREFELIARYFAPLSEGFEGAYGLQDDVAVITPGSGKQVVSKTDSIVAGIHFFPDDPAGLIAQKALRVNLSDLAAKGAVPLYYMLDLILPSETTEEWVASFATGLARDQETFGVHLIGGDTNATPGALTVAITLLGEVDFGQTLRRGGARPGDVIFVTGTIGDAALGLAALHGELGEITPAQADWLIDRYRLPLPRVGVGPQLAGVATASIDISDGLVADLGHVCQVSGLCADVEVARVPFSAAARTAINNDRARLEAALTGGDDYEILFTAPPDMGDRIERLSRRSGVPITAIGRMSGGPSESRERVILRDDKGHPLDISHEGWQHF